MNTELQKSDLKVGDRLQYWWSDETQWGTYGCVLEVVSLEDRGAVCDATYPRKDGSGKFTNVGHRMLYEYSRLRKI